MRDKFEEITIVPVYTTEEASRRIGSSEIDVRNAYVVIDVLTNDIRGTRQRPAASPEGLLRRIDTLRKQLMAAGAAATVICQAKPMEIADVTPFNSLLHEYLQTIKDGTGFGCRTQIRRSFLRPDGYHVRPQFDSVIDKTFACALLGIHVPDPTPWDDFAPSYARRRYAAEFPQMVRRNDGGQRIGFEGPVNNHGWRQ